MPPLSLTSRTSNEAGYSSAVFTLEMAADMRAPSAMIHFPSIARLG